MASLLSCRALGKSFGDQQLFDGIDLVLEPGDRVGLIGPNGSGKSTLLRIICGLEEPDRGRVILRRHTRVGFLAQSDTFTEEKNAVDNLSLALQDLDLDEAERHRRVHAILSRAEFPDADCPVHLLSGGWRKRLAICRALVVHPDVLVMDEPTNHLDIEGILWLERLLCARQPESPAAFLLVSHDRRFLENSVNRVVELSGIYPGGSFQVRGNYTTFLEKRYQFLAQQQDMERRLANKVRRETEWLRRGPKARSSKARFRIDEAHRLRDEL
ncbi:MAG TPA: ABC-F family ATP-binding cassette domain-containing protein, partial [Desulfobulbus sp.]|nr:ABC-F family ATP-binding cassette domain-containing protein [Desulfobulbus sp.]